MFILAGELYDFNKSKDLLEKEMATHSSFLAWKIPWTEEPGLTTVHGVANSRTRLSDFAHSLKVHSTRLWPGGGGVCVQILQ